MAKTLNGTSCLVMLEADLDAQSYTWMWYAQDRPADDGTSETFDFTGTEISNPPRRVLSASELGAGVVGGGLSDGSVLGLINKLKENVETHESVVGGQRVPKLWLQIQLNWAGTHRLRMVSWADKRNDPDNGMAHPRSSAALPGPLLHPRDLTADELGLAATAGDVAKFAADLEAALKTAQGIA